MTTFAPSTEGEASEIVRCARSVAIVGSGSKVEPPPNIDQISSGNLDKTIDWSPDDLIVTVGAGKRITDINCELAERNQCIPFESGTAGGLVATNPPVPWQTWPYDARYWVLGMRVIRGDGTAVKCGSKAVKNVAGYDVQKLVVGSWGTLGFVTEVTFRVFPVQTLAPYTGQGPGPITGDTRNADLMLAVKSVFDPERKFNPGILGSF
jgi:FAD/FMN-containing dehydrogenase